MSDSKKLTLAVTSRPVDGAALPVNKVMRGVLDGACFRARRAKGLDT
jgi:hypothetical protein